MELLQCVNTDGPYRRAYHSEERDINNSSSVSGSSSATGSSMGGGGGMMTMPPVSVSAKSTPRNVRANTLSGDERRVSLPSGHYAHTTGRLNKNNNGFKHYGSSLSLADNHRLDELTSRTLRPPSPTTLRKSSKMLPPSAGFSAKVERSAKPVLPNMRVELESPKLADYLERPRLINAIPLPSRPVRNEAVAASASHHHAKRYESSGIPAYRNLRLGNFMEPSNANRRRDDPEDDDIIPERLRQYYLDTYLNECDTCESVTHCNPVSPIHRGM